MPSAAGCIVLSIIRLIRLVFSQISIIFPIIMSSTSISPAKKTPFNCCTTIYTLKIDINWPIPPLQHCACRIHNINPTLNPIHSHPFKSPVIVSIFCSFLLFIILFILLTRKLQNNLASTKENKTGVLNTSSI